MGDGPHPEFGGGGGGTVGGGRVFVGRAVAGIDGVLVVTGMMVFVGVGSCGGTFGTYSCCPTRMVDEMRQLANMSCSTFTP